MIERNITLRTRFKSYIYLISKAENSVNLDSVNMVNLDKKTIAYFFILLDFSLTVKAAPHRCVIRTSQP